LSKSKKVFFIPATVATVLAVAAVGLLYAFVWRVPAAKEVFDKNSQSVVELKAQTGENLTAYGTAVLINKDGYFVSNAHVVTYTQLTIQHEFEAYAIRYSFETGYRHVALIAYDAEKDLSLLKLVELPDFKLKPTGIGSVDKLKSGDTVYAMGNAMNHGISISQGIISLPQINIEYEGKTRDAIQCDLTINEGNSGGALLNGRGNLIGITTFRIKDRLGNPIYGVAFCVSIDTIKAFLSDNEIAAK
jgi:S1-C subfamily serine protease